MERRACLAARPQTWKEAKLYRKTTISWKSRFKHGWSRLGFTLLILFQGAFFPLFAAQDLIESAGKTGAINWTRGVIQAGGVQENLRKTGDLPLDWETNREAAKAKAIENLLNTAKSVRISGTTVTGELAAADAEIMAKLMEMVKNSTIAYQDFTTDGTVEVTLELSFYGGFSQLVLPEEIQHVESITSLSSYKTVQLPVDSSPGEKPKPEVFTGLIIDASGLEAEPVMVPTLLDENGQEIYGPAFVTREVAVQKGMCLYEKDLSSAKEKERVLDHPLTVRALRIGGPDGSSLVISNTDALKIKSASEHLTFLRECRVVIVMNNP